MGSGAAPPCPREESQHACLSASLSAAGPRVGLGQSRPFSGSADNCGCSGISTKKTGFDYRSGTGTERPLGRKLGQRVLSRSRECGKCQPQSQGRSPLLWSCCQARCCPLCPWVRRALQGTVGGGRAVAQQGVALGLLQQPGSLARGHAASGCPAAPPSGFSAALRGMVLAAGPQGWVWPARERPGWGWAGSGSLTPADPEGLWRGRLPRCWPGPHLHAAQLW